MTPATLRASDRPILSAIERLLVAGVGVTARALNETSQAAELTLAQWRVLAIAAGTDGVRIGELARRLGVGVPSASRLVRRLERHGLATAERDELDRRATIVRASSAGRVVREAVMRRRRELIESALDGALADSTAETVPVLERIADAVSTFA